MQTVIGAFDDRAQAQEAVDRLTRMGIARDDVHIEQQDTGTGTTARSGSAASVPETERSAHHRSFFAQLFGLDDDPVSQPLRSEADTWGEAVHRGGCVVVVDARDDEQAEQAATTLHECGAIDVDERSAQWRQQGWTGGAQAAASTRSEAGAAATEDRTLEVVEEQLQVGKRRIARGGVRVVERISERPVREVVRLREEKAVVERRPVDREVAAGSLESFREGAVEVRESAEEPVVAKTARVVEEVRVGKQVQEREATVEDKVRRKDVEVQRLEGETGSAPRERAVAADRTADNKPQRGTR